MARSSTIHSMLFESKSIEPKQLADTRTFLETTFVHTHIRNVLHMDKAEDLLSNEKLLLIGNEGRSEPGFLCFLPKKPVQFVRCRLDQGVYMRLRVDSSLFDQGTIFIASFDMGILTLQDCWLWKGKSLLQEQFSKRAAYISTFMNQYLIQDPQISGLEVKPAIYYPLTQLQSMIESGDYWSIEFLPENPKRRRCFYRIETAPRATQPPLPAKKPVSAPRPTSTHPPVRTLPPRPPVKELRLAAPGPLVAIAKNIQGLPDTFDLFSYDRKHIGEAAIQEEEISALLRKEFMKSQSLLVLVEWNSFLESYEIKNLAAKGSRISVFQSFTNAGQQQTAKDEVEFAHESLKDEENGE